MRLVPLSPELLRFVIAGERDAMTREIAEAGDFVRLALSPGSDGLILLDGGWALVAGGIVLHWHGRAEAWLFVAEGATRRHLTVATRMAAVQLRALQHQPQYRRIEMHVRALAPWRHDFTRALGMRMEAICPAWDPAGRDYCLYSRIAPSRLAGGQH